MADKRVFVLCNLEGVDKVLTLEELTAISPNIFSVNGENLGEYARIKKFPFFEGYILVTETGNKIDLSLGRKTENRRIYLCAPIDYLFKENPGLV